MYPQSQQGMVREKNPSDILNKLTVQSILSSVGIKSSNMDDILEGSLVDVENRISMIKTRLDQNDMIVQDKKAQLSAKMNEFNSNLKSQNDLYNFGGGDSENNLFSQLKVYRGSLLSDTRQSLQSGILSNVMGIDDLSTDDSKDTFLKKLNETRIFKEPDREMTYLSMVKDIQTRRIGGEKGPDISMINSDLKEIQRKYISQLQGLFNSVGADKPYYTGMKDYGINGYQSNRGEGYLQMPVIMNSARYKTVNVTTYLHHGTENNSYIGINYDTFGGPGDGNATSLQLRDVRVATGDNDVPADKTQIIRTRGSNMALFVDTEEDSGDNQGSSDFKLTSPVNLTDNEINNVQKDLMIQQQTMYNGVETPPNVIRGTGRIVRTIVRGNGTYIEATDPRKCLAGLIPFDESLFVNLLDEKQGGMIQNINTSSGVTDTPIKWRGEEITIQRGKPNSLYSKKEELKATNEIFPKLKKGLTDTSDYNMINVLEIKKICEEFAKEVLKCNENGQGDGWDGLGWLFTASTNNGITGGDFNPEYRDNGANRHLMKANSQNIRVVYKQVSNVGGLQLGGVYRSVENDDMNDRTNTAAMTDALDITNYDNLRPAYTNLNGDHKLIDSDDLINTDEWNFSSSSENAKNIAELTRRRCILFLFHFLEKAFNATWYCYRGGETGNYKVVLDPKEVYKKLSDWDSVQKWWSYTKNSTKCVNSAGAVCTYRNENGSELLPEQLNPAECLLCFARHLFIGRGKPGDDGRGCRNAWESDSMLWDAIEKLLPKLYRCAIVIKNRETVKNFYTKLNTLKQTSPLLSEAKKVGKDKTSRSSATESKLLNEYPQDMYRDLLIRMYDIDANEGEKRYCCCKNEWTEFSGGDVGSVVPCDVCAVAHYFFDMPEAVSSYDYRLYNDENNTERSRLNSTVPPTFKDSSDQARVLTNWAGHAVSDWHNYILSSNDAGGIYDENGNILKGLNRPFNPQEQIRIKKATSVLNFDTKQNSINYGSYIVNDPNYAKKEAEYKLKWPKVFIRFEQDPTRGGVFTLGNREKPDPSTTSARKSHIQKHCKEGTPPYPIKHLNFKAYLIDHGPLFFDMKRIHGQAKNILINYISGWESRKERYDMSKKDRVDKKQDVQKDVLDSSKPQGDIETKPDASLTEDQSVSTTDEMPGDKIEDILPYEEKDLDEPIPSSIEDAKSKQVVEFSDYKELEDEYNRVKQEISRRNSLLEDMISSYRENKMIDTSDRTAQRIREESDNKRIMVMRAKIKELERKQKRQLNFLRVAMSNMQEKFEIYKKQEEEINQFKENERRSKLESEMNRLVANQKEKDSKHMRDLHIQNLRKKQGEYMGLSEDSLHGDYDIMRLNSKMSSRSLPPIYSEVKKAKKPKKRTQSKKRANKRNSQKKKKTPKK